MQQYILNSEEISEMIKGIKYLMKKGHFGKLEAESYLLKKAQLRIKFQLSLSKEDSDKVEENQYLFVDLDQEDDLDESKGSKEDQNTQRNLQPIDEDLKEADSTSNVQINSSQDNNVAGVRDSFTSSMKSEGLREEIVLPKNYLSTLKNLK